MPKVTNLESGELCTRRRGRPVGRNRVPLSLEERRARNAQYERERRSEATEAMAQLSEAAGCDANIPNAELLATVLAQIQRAASSNPNNDIEEIKLCNESLMQEIAELEQRLGLSDVDEAEKENLYQNDTPVGSIRKRTERNNSKRHIALNANEELSVATSSYKASK